MEERFERTGCILHVHVGGEVIRTTPEHPFFVQGEGWKQAGALSGGDRIATLSGEWVSVEEVLDTQEWEPVYNLRVAGHHTYFVGDEGWGWAAWAHNTYDFISGRKVAELVQSKMGTVALTAQGRDTIISQVLAEGAKELEYSAVGDAEDLSNRISSALVNANATQQVQMITQAMKDYFIRPPVRTDRRQRELAIKNRKDWVGYIQTSLGDQDALGRSRSQYEQYSQTQGLGPTIHGHLIINKLGAAGGTAKPQARDARDILLYYGINPYWDRENLAYAPNRPHTAGQIRYMDQQLIAMYNAGQSRGSVVAKLVEFANAFIAGTLQEV